jgi:hypothetical protein
MSERCEPAPGTTRMSAKEIPIPRNSKTRPFRREGDHRAVFRKNRRPENFPRIRWAYHQLPTKTGHLQRVFQRFSRVRSTEELAEEEGLYSWLVSGR